MIIGVHSPEFAFEHVASNVAAAIKRLGIRYPVVQDNNFATWTNYSNEYWPAEYLIDQQGRIRAYDIGEGDYAETEQNIRELLGVSNQARRGAGPDADRADDARVLPRLRRGSTRCATPAASSRRTRRKTYPPAPSGAARLARLLGHLAGRAATTPSPGRTRRSRLHFQAKDVYLVLGGNGKVSVVDRRQAGEDGRRRLVQALHAAQRPAPTHGLMTLRFTPGVAGLRVHVRVDAPLLLLAGRRALAAVLLALAQEARQLGGERLARRELASSSISSTRLSSSST